MIAIGSDHAGFEYKEKVKRLLETLGRPCRDFGTSSTESTDYPDYAHAASQALTSGEAERGILICGSGIGMSIVANKHKGVRAAVCESVESARLARKHNDANVLALGARMMSWEKAEEIILVFLNTPFDGGRHQRRVDKIDSVTKL